MAEEGLTSGIDASKIQSSMDEVQQIYDELARKFKTKLEEFIGGMSGKWRGENAKKFFQSFSQRINEFFEEAGGINGAYASIINWMNYNGNQFLAIDQSSHAQFNQQFHKTDIVLDVSSILGDGNIIGMTPAEAKDYAKNELNEAINGIQPYIERTISVASTCGFLNQEIISNLTNSLNNITATMRDNFNNYFVNQISAGIDANADAYIAASQAAAEGANAR